MLSTTTLNINVDAKKSLNKERKSLMVSKPKVYISIDCEVDGPAPPFKGSMFWFGAVLIDTKLDTTFSGQMSPVSSYYEVKRLKISELTRAETRTFRKPEIVMPLFVEWVHKVSAGKEPRFISDNTGFDFGLMNYYLWKYTNNNPFGHSSLNIKQLYCGLEGDIRSSFKHLVITPHTHNPVDDAKGNAQAFIAMTPRLKIVI